MPERIIGDRNGSHLIYDLESARPSHAWLSRLFVPKSNGQRRQGKGSRLLEEFFELARANGVTEVTTIIHPDGGEDKQGVIKFAEKHGFKPKHPFINTEIYIKKL